MSTKADWAGTAKAVEEIVAAAEEKMLSPIVGALSAVAGSTLTLGAASTAYTRSPPAVPVCVGVRFESNQGYGYASTLGTMPVITGYRIAPVPPVRVGEETFEVVVSVIPPSPPVMPPIPAPPVHDMTPVAAELAKLLESERERLRFALADLSSVTAERDKAIELRDDVASQLSDALVEVRALKGELDFVTRERDDYRDKVYELNEEILKLENRIDMLKEQL